MVIVSFRKYLLYNLSPPTSCHTTVIVSFRKYLLYNHSIGSTPEIVVIVSFRKYLLYNVGFRKPLGSRKPTFLYQKNSEQKQLF